MAKDNLQSIMERRALDNAKIFIVCDIFVSARRTLARASKSVDESDFKRAKQ